jgi:hypothetical protein
MSWFNFMAGKVDEWQRANGVEFVKFSDPYPAPVYDENGERVRIVDASPLRAMCAEVVRRARLDPLYAISPKAAIERQAKALKDEMDSEKKGRQDSK